MAGAVFSQGQEHISWQGQHFRKVKYKFRGRGSIFARSSSIFARSSTDIVAGAAFSQGQVAGAALSQGQVQISWQAQHCHKVKYR